MALKATIFKATLEISDLDRAYFATHHLTLARHPSETDERMMVRLLAFALMADERLEFCKGLSDVDDADLRETDLTGAIVRWIEIGQPEPKRLQKACAQAGEVIVVSYGRQVDAWWERVRAALPRHAALRAWRIPDEASRALAHLAQRNMHLVVTIQESLVYVDGGGHSLQLTPEPLLLTAPANASR
jgi:uncharacterized protein YaeQ